MNASKLNKSTKVGWKLTMLKIHLCTLIGITMYALYKSDLNFKLRICIDIADMQCVQCVRQHSKQCNLSIAYDVKCAPSFDGIQTIKCSKARQLSEQ